MADQEFSDDSQGEGNEIPMGIERDHAFELSRAATPEAVLEGIRNYRGRLPRDFVFSREDANER